MIDDEVGLLRPRWATYSTIDHQNTAKLATEVLLYDRLIFPVPPREDRSELERWRENNWGPDQALSRLQELGDLAHGAEWTQNLREQWGSQFERLQKVGNDSLACAYNVTSRILADSARAEAANGHPPIPIAAFQSISKAEAVLDVVNSEADTYSDRIQDIHRGVGLLVQRNLRLPEPNGDPDVLKRAIALAHNEDFIRARRSLYRWEDELALRGWPAHAAIAKLDKQIEQFNALVSNNFAQTWLRRVWRAIKIVVPAASGFAGAVAFGPPGSLVGAGASLTLLAIEARFPRLDASPQDMSLNPATAIEAMSALAHNNG